MGQRAGTEVRRRFEPVRAELVKNAESLHALVGLSLGLPLLQRNSAINYGLEWRRERANARVAVRML